MAVYSGLYSLNAGIIRLYRFVMVLLFLQPILRVSILLLRVLLFASSYCFLVYKVYGLSVHYIIFSLVWVLG